jgi:diguanylate cyclase (GGDEF)-like protein
MSWSYPYTVLVADDDASALALLTRRLEREGYRVVAAGDGRAALEAARRSRPDLVILDVGMPGMDGHETVRRLRADSRTALTPVIFLTCHADPEEKIAGLEEGADDYLVKPCDPRELAARVRACLERSRKLRALTPEEGELDRQRLEWLRALVEPADGTIVPSPDAESPFGYRYGVKGSSHASDPERAFALLEDLAFAGCLEREFFDTIHLCRACRRYNLNFREVCAACGSPDIEVADLIHHFRCALVAPASRFQRGSRYVCPKCDRELRHIGVDYEKPSQSFCCRRCDAAFREPSVACVCLSCGAKALAEELLVERLHAYRLTPKGRLAAESGHLYEVDAGRLARDPSLGIPGAPSLLPSLAAEIARARRFDRPLSLLLLSLDGAAGSGEAVEEDVAAGVRLREAAAVLRRAVRETDLPCRFGGLGLACILPETSEAEALELAASLEARLLEECPEAAALEPAIAVAELEPELATEEALLSAALARLEEARLRPVPDEAERP